MENFFINFYKIIIKIINNYIYGDWGLGSGDWGLGIGPNPQLALNSLLYLS